MNRKLLCVLFATLAVAPFGCNRQKSPISQEAAPLASVVRTGDPTAARQLVSGFHAIENGAWRWTQRKFEVELAVPPGAAARGAVLEARFTVPPVTIEKVKSQTLTTSVGGTALKPATLDTAGPFTYSREIEPAQLATPTVKIAFELDKALPQEGGDIRELGIVANNFLLKAR